MKITLIAAVSENGIIGSDNEIPWDLPEDRSQYKERVKGEVIVYGSNSFSPNTGRSSPSKHQILLTRSNRSTESETSTYVSGVDEAINLAEQMNVEELFILGGGEIYSQFIDLADEMILTEVPGEYEGTARFPDWETKDWTPTKREQYENFEVVHYQRVTQ